MPPSLDNMVLEKSKPPQTKKHCCGNIVADANVSLFARARNVCCRRKICVRDAKDVSEFFQKHFASATNVSPNVSWFARQGSKTFVLLPTRLLDVETLRGNNVSATMFPRLRGP